VISHDERFLNNIATCILDVDYETITAYPGNFSSFLTEKVAVYERKAAEIARAEAIVAEKRAWVERFGAKATKARQAQSRLKQIEKIEIGQLETTSRRAPLFQFLPQRASGRDVLEVDQVSKAYGEKRVLKNVSLTVRRGERVAILGANGLGKSTLLKIATGRLEADGGKVKWGHETHVGYFPQDHHEVLVDGEATALDVVWAVVPSEATSYVRGQLGRVLFSGEAVAKKVASLSGGEAARLVFCCMMVSRPNVLVLDEPTNHLDLESIHALVKALQEFDGTVLFVSHDRAFVSALATRVLEVTKEGFRDFPGTYDEYLADLGDDHLDTSAVVLRAKKEKAVSTSAALTPASEGISWEEQKRRNNRKKQLPALRDAAVRAIEEAESRKAALHAMWCEPGFYEKTPAAQIASLESEEKELLVKIDALMAEWEALEKEIAELGA
jgi:ATPase subunit of ABC transporter with duplicated ATPase domains